MVVSMAHASGRLLNNVMHKKMLDPAYQPATMNALDLAEILLSLLIFLATGTGATFLEHYALVIINFSGSAIIARGPLLVLL